LAVVETAPGILAAAESTMSEAGERYA